jgi:type IV secretory pathway protease TraF
VEGSKKLSLKRRIWSLGIVAIIGALSLVFFGWFWPHIDISKTNSAGNRVFWISRDFAQGDIKKGTWIYAPLYAKVGDVPCNPCMVIKEVSCDSGEILVAEKRCFSCNGVYIGKAKTHSKNGEPVLSFEFKGTIPEGKAFVMGGNPNSYDSRYWGFLEKNNVKGIATPLF